MQSRRKIKSAFFITFNGNCKKALTLYQSCFGGELSFDVFEVSISGMKEQPVIRGSLVSEMIVIHGSDLVHNEGRRVGNFMSVYFHCDDSHQRLDYLKKLDGKQKDYATCSEQKLIEITDAFEVRWLFGI